jgi:hypothetical protein
LEFSHLMKPLHFIVRPLFSSSCLLWLASCGTMQDPELGAGLGMALSSIGGQIGGDGGRLVSAAGMAISYQASIAQRNLAEERAQAALQKSSVKKTVAAKKARYVAVPVKPSDEQKAKTKSKNLVMLYDTETGTAKATAYEPKKASYSQNEEASCGGHRAVVAQSFAGI